MGVRVLVLAASTGEGAAAACEVDVFRVRALLQRSEHKDFSCAATFASEQPTQLSNVSFVHDRSVLCRQVQRVVAH